MAHGFANDVPGTFVAALALVALPGLAWSQTAQQERMKSCNAQASKKEMKGDERKAFMSRCLSGDSAATGRSARQR